jgi:hypothetical protein
MKFKRSFDSFTLDHQTLQTMRQQAVKVIRDGAAVANLMLND